VPFARLDGILLLIKKHLKGKIADMLNAKDNQVFLDYLAGGPSEQIASERVANADSKGALSVAARNLVGGHGSERMLTEAARDARRLMESMEKAKASYVDFSETKLVYEEKLHQAELKRKAEMQAHELLIHEAEMKHKAEMEAQEMKRKADMETQDMKRKANMEAQEMKRKAEMQAYEMKLKAEIQAQEMKLKADMEERDLKRKAEVHEEELKHKRKMLWLEVEAKQKMIDLRMAEAKAEEAFARALQQQRRPKNTTDNMQKPKQTLQACAAGSYFQDEGAPAALQFLSGCQIPKTLEEIAGLVQGSGEHAAFFESRIFKLQAYEEELCTRKQQLSERVESGEDTGHASASLKICVLREQHYCNLVFWALVRSLLPLHVYTQIMGETFDHEHKCDKSDKGLKMYTWFNLDEAVFHLPVDVDNVPELVKELCCEGIEGDLLIRALDKWKNKPIKANARHQWKEKLWKFKAFVAQKLCKHVQRFCNM
jgi:hypothetical protein